MKTLLVSAVSTALLLASCGADTGASEGALATEEVAPTDAPMISSDVATFGLPNFSQPEDGLVCTGQLNAEQMDRLSGMGYGFISLRDAGEKGAGWEEAHAEAEGIDFQRLTIKGAAGVTEDAAKELAKVLGEAEGPTVLYCGSSNRVGALLALKAHHLDGMSAEEALTLGKSAGVTGLEPKLKELLGL